MKEKVLELREKSLDKIVSKMKELGYKVATINKYDATSQRWEYFKYSALELSSYSDTSVVVTELDVVIGSMNLNKRLIELSEMTGIDFYYNKY